VEHRVQQSNIAMPEKRTIERARKDARDATKGRGGTKRKTSAKRSRATTNALKREGRSAVSRKNLSKQAKSAARRRAA